jgi:hypothetical protein
MADRGNFYFKSSLNAKPVKLTHKVRKISFAYITRAAFSGLACAYEKFILNDRRIKLPSGTVLKMANGPIIHEKNVKQLRAYTSYRILIAPG